MERRKYPRAQLALPLKFRLVGDLMELWQGGTVLDVSAGGLRFVSPQAFDQGAALEFELALPAKDEPYRLFGQVVWWKAIASDLCEYGVEFTSVTQDKRSEIDELVQFLIRRPAGT